VVVSHSSSALILFRATEGLIRCPLTGFDKLSVLLTSYRDFENDHEWEWLHNDSPYASALAFEPTSDGSGNKAEMVVTNEWKSKVSV
jgi:hypothetical protein